MPKMNALASNLPTPAPLAGPTLIGYFRRQFRFSARRSNGTKDWLLIVTLSGAGIVKFPSARRVIPRGHALLYSPGAPHDYSADHSWEILWAHFVPPQEWTELLAWPEISQGLRLLELKHARTRRATVTALRRAWEFSNSNLRRQEEFINTALHEAFLWCDMENPSSAERRTDFRVRRALDLLTNNLKRPFSLNAVARDVGLSVSRLAQLFKQQTSLSPRQYWETHRLQHGRHLLERTQISVAEIAEEVGFPDPFYFSTRFKKIVGMSPKQYRAKQEKILSWAR